VEQRAYRAALARRGQAVDRRRWWIEPYHGGAVLLFQQNAHNFAAGLLQPTKFDAQASDAANFGAIGAIAGHEMTHFIDTLGAEYQNTGRKRAWWTEQDRAGYQATTAPLVAQFSAYRPLADTPVDGKTSLTENLADLSGLTAAFAAHRKRLGDRISDPAHVRQQDRLFFIAFARAWRSTYTDEGLRRQAASTHAPERHRISTVRNLDAWYEAFDVRPGHRLYLEPNDRVRVW
jgi:putative endopeptidase